MAGLLYSAYQKFYSALINFDRFDKEGDFFSNISCLDAFFSEYRNITFAMQASLKHTKYFSIYEKNRDIFLKDHWFVEKRNETTKQTPFKLIKELVITIYFPYHGYSILDKSFSVENDTPLETVFDNLKKFFAEIPDEEIFFSASFKFHEANSSIDLFDKLISGINSMRKFIKAMDDEIDENCPLCEKLKENIAQIKTINVSKDFLLVNDYIYYPKKDFFERGARCSLSMSLDGERTMNRLPISSLINSKYFNYDGTVFGNFTFMHAILRSVKPGMDIMPAIMLVYEDQTYDLDVFHADIKTTVYRKINEVAKLIKIHNIQEVCYMGLYAVLTGDAVAANTSKERIDLSKSDILVCASVDNKLNEKEYVFDGKEMEKPEYVACVMKNGLADKLFVSRNNMFPIWRAFKKKINN